MIDNNSNLMVFRTLRNKNYRTISLICVQDKKLSWKAKGLHTYLITRPDNWEVRINDLLNRSEDGSKSLYTGIRELIEARYVFRIQKRDEKNQIKQWGYLTTEEPKSLEEVQKSLDLNEEWKLVKSKMDSENPDVQNVHVGFEHVDKDNNKENKGEKIYNVFEEGDLQKRNGDGTAVPIVQESKKKIIRDNKPIVVISMSAQRIISHWNNLGSFIPKSNINVKSKTYELIIKKINCLLEKYSEEEIIRSMNNYKFVVDIDFPILRPTIGKIVSLIEFIEFNARNLKKHLRYNPELIGMDSWFKECLKTREELQIKWSKFVTDEHPEETKELKRLWYEFGGRDLNAVEDENTFRRISNKAYNYFKEIEDQYNWNIGRQYVLQKLRYIFEALKAEGQDFKRMKPHYLLAKNMFIETLPIHWERIALNKAEHLDPMEERYEWEKGAKTREFNSHFAENVTETREQLLARIAKQSENQNDVQENLNDY